MPVKPDFILFDAVRVEKITCPQEPIVRGDSLSFSIAAASILAKVFRDRLMAEADKRYPGYGFSRNKGYGVPEHRKGLDKLGVTPIHRKSFKPVAAHSQ
ncbi:MAG: ribonuclease HII [Spirochaetia bacterium]|nr:ribonuclease HII [Spirochaetia bacterium]